jgi:hypothetical protein
MVTMSAHPHHALHVTLEDNNIGLGLQSCVRFPYNWAHMYMYTHTHVHERTSQFGRTPLHFAANHGYTRIISLLLESGADPDATDMVGMSVRTCL